MSYGFQRFFFLFYCLACFWPELGAESNLRVVNEWAELEFVFPDEETKQIAMTKQHYVPGKSIPIDVDIQYRKDTLSPRIFVTTPRFRDGRPVTLGTVDEKGKISGYPDYSWHENQGQNCGGLTSVYRTARCFSVPDTFWALYWWIKEKNGNTNNDETGDDLEFHKEDKERAYLGKVGLGAISTQTQIQRHGLNY
ncbi:major royal jelly protein 2-like, partial [Hyposmocoma kahamanoa]|uniref:major royal jelly protein 2-like n=1 Tax=Hyposmocoma kahamanoa TaxID=1477025 RepID=UPI000E6D8B05